MKHLVSEAVAAAYQNAALANSWPPLDREIEISVPKEEKFGDFSCNLAMPLAKTLKQNPRSIATAIVEELAKNDLFTDVSIAGPGFINMTIDPARWVAELGPLFVDEASFGQTNDGQGEKVMVEFVSANPTGPLHIGHGRGAAVGDALARILAAAGYAVHSEYYVNDVGLQMDNLGRSTIARAKELKGRDFEAPAYKGDYMIDVARRFLDKEGEAILDGPEDKLLTAARRFAANDILADIRKDLNDFRVSFDEWFSEATLHDSDEVTGAIDTMLEQGALYENEGAIWLKTSSQGDEKDRVVRRQNGITTYLAADIAYHKNKFDRGFDSIVNVWGADHHGYIPRMRAVVEALGHDPDRMVVRLVQIVNLKRGGAVLPMSTREGVFTTLREIMDEVGVDATRYFFLMRSVDSHLDFDVDLAKTEGDENPVYYIQYAHARCANIFVTANERGIAPLSFEKIDPALLTGEDEVRLIKKLLSLPDFVSAAARLYQPHLITQYLSETAAAFHYFYKHNRVVTDDIPLSQARLCLVKAVKVALHNGLALIGVSAPDKM